MSEPQDNWVEEAALAAYEPTANWLSANAAQLPTEVSETLRLALQLGQSVAELKRRARGRFRELLRALGVVPSSEKRGRADKKPQGRLDAVYRLRDKYAKAERMGRWHGQLAKRHRAVKKALSHKLKEAEAMQFDAQEEAEIAAEAQAKTAASMARIARGDGPDSALAAPAEALMRGATTTVAHDTVSCPVEDEDLPKGAVAGQSFVQARQRIDFSFHVTVLDIEVEKKAVKTTDGAQRLFTGSLNAVGPAKMRVTWNFLAHMVMLVSQYAMPMHRFARLVSTSAKGFTAAEMSRYYQCVARHFAPVYNHLGVSLSRASVLSGDDTSSLVLQVSRYQAAADGEAPPWQDYATLSQAQGSQTQAHPSLGCMLGSVWPFVCARKDGKGDKTSLNTSVVIGRAQADDPRSTVVFYRSHFGGLGDILSALISRRAPRDGNLVVQSDLCTVNLVTSQMRQRFAIVQAGCASHARRPFVRHQADDPEACGYILDLFESVFLFEAMLDSEGRNRVNTSAVRQVDERACWEGIRDACGALQDKWPRTSELGQAARYVLRHYDTLTYYLSDPRVAASNNLPERMLRMEKLIGNNAMFRQSLEGRFALDIMRTVLQTAIATEVDLRAYVIWVLQMSAEAVAADPGAFTPTAFAQWWAEQTAIEELAQAVV